MFFQVNHNMLLARNFIQKSQIVLLSSSLDRQRTSKMKTLLDLWEYYQTTIKPKKTTQHLKFYLPRHQIFSSFFWILKESNKRHWLSFGGLLSLSLSIYGRELQHCKTFEAISFLASAPTPNLGIQ